ncbi:hypothetical protein UMC2_23841 [[Clostridium] sordellii]|uniref:hypothetical protein n=1 Tax=Paraclostridium sordellii TaxID=1505 RepID=UPI000319E7B6|nr:hypothetical protein [Paeniclostridium sordellii]CEK35428.1 hypothetical protein UMC2_23841 [[Clostridium] sordellii] [Paeniclostridium sordellii]
MEDLRYLQSMIELKISNIELKICELLVKNNEDNLLKEIELLKLESKLDAYKDTLTVIKNRVEIVERNLEDLKIFEVNNASTYGLA